MKIGESKKIEGEREREEARWITDKFNYLYIWFWLWQIESISFRKTYHLQTVNRLEHRIFRSIFWYIFPLAQSNENYFIFLFFFIYLTFARLHIWFTIVQNIWQCYFFFRWRKQDVLHFMLNRIETCEFSLRKCFKIFLELNALCLMLSEPELN